MYVRAATIAIGVLDALGWAAVAWTCFESYSDKATIGFDFAAGMIVTGLFLVTVVPSLILSCLGRAAKTALALGLAFPAIFVVLFIAAVIEFV
jgi:hypothetical protein